MDAHFDVAIVGGGPAGLSGALNLGRGRRRVLVLDAGARRNASAEHVHGFVTRDGVTPDEFRRQGRAQLAAYPNVELRDVGLAELRGQRGAFELETSGGDLVHARRVLLCTGMIDVLPEIDGFRERWGRSIFQCPYCHGWEVQDRRFGFLAPDAGSLDFALLLRGWTGSVVAFTDGRFPVPDELRTRLTAAAVGVEERRLARVAADEIQLEGGAHLPIDVLFAKPPQRVVPAVAALGLELTPEGYLRIDEHQQTSRPGVYAAGDLVTAIQGAVLAAASGAFAAAMLNHDLTPELASAGII